MKERSPGVKILWLWTIGTAGILVASVMRTRMKDMENLISNTPDPEQQQQLPDTIPADSTVIHTDDLQEGS